MHRTPNFSETGWQDATILTVDDEPLICRTIDAYLRHYGFQNVSQHANALTALETIERRKPQLVLLDILMPEVGGIEILARLKANPLLSDTIVVMLSAADMEAKYRALELGAADFINKPVNPHELAVRVRHAIAIHSKVF